VSWAAPVNNGGYEITSYTVEDAVAEVSQDVSGDVTETTIVGLTNGETYSFTITATNFAGTSLPSDPVVLTPEVAILTPPTNVTAYFDVNLRGFLSVSWTAPTNTGGFTIYRYRVDPFGEGPISTATTYITQYASVGTEYTVTVTALFLEGGESPTSEPSAPPLLYGFARPPRDVSAGLVDISNVLVTWTPPITDGGFDIFTYTVTLEPGTITQIVYTWNATETTIPDLIAGVFYTITVVATNNCGDSQPSLPLSFSYGTAPDPPTDVAGVAGNESVTVSWTAPVNSGGYAITSYTVEDAGAGVSQDVSGNVTETSVLGLTNGTTYSFTVTATNFAGPSLPSDPVVLTPQAATLTPPTGVTAYFDSANSPGVMFVSWTPPTETGGLTIFRYNVEAIGFSMTSVTTTFSTTYLTPGLEYSFTVTAVFNEGGESPPSEPSAPILFGPPRPPTVVGGFLVFDTYADIIWTRPVTDGGYPILSYTVTLEPGAITRTVNDGDALNVQISDCIIGTTYTVTAIATNQINNSVVSVPFTFLFAGRPDPPSGLMAMGEGPGVAYVQWSEPYTRGSPIINNKILINSWPSAGPTLVQIIGPDTSTFINNLSPDTYVFRIIAVNEMGESLPSEPSNPVLVYD
jgi:titin